MLPVLLDHGESTAHRPADQLAPLTQKPLGTQITSTCDPTSEHSKVSLSLRRDTVQNRSSLSNGLDAPLTLEPEVMDQAPTAQDELPLAHIDWGLADLLTRRGTRVHVDCHPWRWVRKVAVAATLDEDERQGM